VLESHKLLYLRWPQGRTDFSCDLKSCSHTPTTHMAKVVIILSPLIWPHQTVLLYSKPKFTQGFSGALRRHVWRTHWRTHYSRKAPSKETLQHTGILCIILQHNATHSHVWRTHYPRELPQKNICNTLQHTATHCNTLQQTVMSDTHFILNRLSKEKYCNTPRYTETHCNTLQHTATHYNTLNCQVSAAKELSVPSTWV